MNPGEQSPSQSQSQSHSRKKCNEDDTDRPLKKAKYLWQVKGKYHLKDNQTSSSSETTKNDNILTGSATSNTHSTHPLNNNNTTIQKTSGTAAAMCSDRSCFEAIIANSDKYMEFSLIDNDKNIDKSISDEIPITLVKQQHHQTDDYYLRKWQARQIAKGFLDNTINRVLEHWMVAPFDAADFVENCDNGGQVEDEGILMAIQSHGLQSGMQQSSLVHCNTRMAMAMSNCTCTTSMKAAPPASASPSSHKRASGGGAGIDNLMPLPFHQRAEPDLNDFHYYEDKPPPATHEHEQIVEDDDDIEMTSMNDTDFLDAAVAVAIQKKGLTSLNCVDCG